jgi:hypothetical protein
MPAASCEAAACGLVGALTVSSYSSFGLTLLIQFQDVMLRKKKPPPAQLLYEGCALVLDSFRC